MIAPTPAITPTSRDSSIKRPWGRNRLWPISQNSGNQRKGCDSRSPRDGACDIERTSVANDSPFRLWTPFRFLSGGCVNDQDDDCPNQGKNKTSQSDHRNHHRQPLGPIVKRVESR